MASNPERSTAPDAGELARRLHLAVIHLLRRLRREDDALGLSAAQLSAVTCLVRRGPITIGDLAAAEGVSAPTMTRQVQRLEQQGLVVRRTSPADGRVSEIRHTSRAMKLLEDGKAARERAFGADLETLPAADREALARAIDVLETLSRPDDG